MGCGHDVIELQQAILRIYGLLAKTSSPAPMMRCCVAVMTIPLWEQS
jgi:hypothetical protein